MKKTLLLAIALVFSLSMFGQQYSKNNVVNSKKRVFYGSQIDNGSKAVIFSDDFEAGNLDEWTTSDEDGDGNDWGTFDNSGNGYSIVATSASYTSVALTPENWLISPALDLTTYGVADFQFEVYAQDPDWAGEHYKFLVSTTDNAVASFTDNLLEETLPGSDVYTKNVDLSDYAGQVIYVAIVHYDCTDMFRLNIDNVVVTGEEAPAGFNVTFNVDMNDAIANLLFDPEVDVLYATGSFVNWTEPGLDIPNQLLSDVDADGIYTMARVDAAGDYAYKYFKNDGWSGGEWNGDPNRAYSVVDADVELNDVWGTLAVNNIDANISVSPNPTRGMVTVSANSNYNVSIIDLSGRVISTSNMTNNSTTIDLSNQAAGLYIISLTNDVQTLTYKVVVE